MTKFLNISTDNTLGGNSPSDELVSSQKAIKEYIANAGTGANTSLSNLTSTGQNIANWSSNVTNCITEIPQDIKLELSGETLTVKAGSKVYVPNGAGVFDVVTIASDITRTGWGSGSNNLMVAYDSNNSNWGGFTLAECFSGSSAPSGSTNMLWYDTTNNKVKQTNNSGSTWNEGWSLPLFIINRSSGTITGIDQVFNGFGYIGSTIFALPGVKGLIPNGRNDDGTLKNTAFINEVCVIATLTGTHVYSMRLAHNYLVAGVFPYDEKTNRNYNDTIAPGNERNQVNAGMVEVSSGTILSMNAKTVFHTVDYSDTEYVAHQAMPSDKYIDLTLGASGATYTAPADGYVVFAKVNGTSAGRLAELVNHSNGLRTISFAPYSVNPSMVFLPVKKGDVFSAHYDSTGNTQVFRFVYAEGAI